MSDVAAWLEKLGLSKYQNVFAENEIDFEILPELTEQDLKDLDIPLGPRKKLRKAITLLAANNADIATAESTPTTPQAERRQLTVMFVDLVGSTALSGRLDPEDLSAVMRRYQNTVSGEISRLEGYIARYMGDGVLAYFGWPRAHEDEAERAVRAGLAITQEVAKLKSPDGQALAARVGIATGLVVVGDLVGEGAAREETVVGETPNIAARLQALAEPGAIVISVNTRHLCGELFELQSLGEQSLKGVAAALQTFRVIGERATDSRYQAQRSGAVLPLIGREPELAQIMARWQQAKCGEGQMILLSGEAGIGKSRLIRAVEDALENQPHYRIGYQCSPYHSDSALYPVIQQLMRAAGFTAEDNNDTRLDKLETLLELAFGEPSTRAPLIAALLNIDGETRYGKRELSPQQQRTQTLQALIEQFTGLARHKPVLFVIEDAHWIDPTTLELTELALDVISQSNILLLITARPTFEHHFGGHPIATRVMLNQLAREASLAIIDRLSGNKPLPEDLLDEIIRKTDGVPLFVEELTKTVLESGQLRETASAYVLDVPLRSIDIPESLHDSLMARLDRLQPVREVVQTAACIGREFSYALLAAVAGEDDQKLQAALAQLTDAELLFRRGTPPQASYTFKHALVRDAAYESMLHSRRQILHARIAKAVPTLYPELAKTQPELLARHYAKARLAEPASSYWLKAGREAIRRSANAEAVSHFRSGLAVISAIAEERIKNERELSLQLGLGLALQADRGFAVAEVEAVFLRACSLAKALRDEREYSALRGLGAHYLMRGQSEITLKINIDILALAQRQQETIKIWDAHRCMATCAFFRGAFPDAMEHVAILDKLYDPEAYRENWLLFGIDNRTASLAYKALTQWFLGYPERSLHNAQKALQLAREIPHPFSLTLICTLISMLHLSRRDPEQAQYHGRQTMDLCAQHGFNHFFAVGTIISGWATAITTPGKMGINRIHEGIELSRSVGTLLFELCGRVVLADAHMHRNDLDQAAEVLNELADEMAEAHFYLAEVYRLQGELSARLANSATDSPNPEVAYQKSLDIARQQEAKSLELRTVTNLARLWCDQGKRQEAREVLAPVYNWFTEGFNTADLQNAKALLDELA